MMKTSRRLVASALSMGLGLTLWGCSTDTITGPGEQPVPNGFPNAAVGVVSPQFDPTAGNPALLPLPNDLLRNPGTTDPTKAGLVDQFPSTPQFQAEPFASLRTMRGFSTCGNILIPFTGRIDANSVNTQTIMMVEGPASNAPAGTPGTNATIPCNLRVVNPEQGGVGNSTIVMQPIRPLKPFTNYFVVITNNIQAGGRGIGSNSFTQATKVRDPFITPSGNFIFPVPDSSATALEPLRVFYQPIWQRAESILGRDRSEIAMAFRFGTQPLFAALPTLRGTANAQDRAQVGSAALAPGLFPSVAAFYAANGLGAVPNANIGRIAQVVFSTVNYISPGATADGTPTGNFQGSGLPGEPIIPQGDKNKNAFLCMPVAFPLGNPPPVIIFQHGLTRSKSDVFAIADSLCGQGFAVMATDAVGHGDDTPPTPPGVVPPITSGAKFLNLAFLRNSRDNFRQSAVNLYYLAKLISAGRVDTDGVPGSDVNNLAPIGYLGQSLGGIIGGVYTSTDPLSRNAVLNVAGGRLSDLVLNSTNIRPAVVAGLAAQGVAVGTDTFNQFFLIGQTVLDDGDAFNYAAPALTGALKGGAAAASRVLQQEAVGDATVPNSASRDLANAFSQVPGFSHVQPIVEALGLVPQVNPGVFPAGFAGSGFFQYPGAQHGFLLDPAQGNTAAVRLQSIRFLATGLAGIPSIVNPFTVFPNPKADTGGIPYVETWPDHF
jgi:dienelactone hydrolase